MTVEISDTQACCSTPKAIELHQTRSCAWQSGRFAQVAGAASFVPHTQKIDLSVEVDSVSWSARAGDHRIGAITVKITNNSTVTSGDLLLMYADRDQDFTTFHLAHLGGHATITKTVTVEEIDGGYDGGNSDVMIDELGSQSIGGDANPKNDWAMVTMWY